LFESDPVIHCPHCNIQYSPGRKTCPGCNAFETPRDAHLAYLKNDAIGELQDGDDPEHVRSQLIKRGFSDLEADTLVRQTLSAIKAENRRWGIVPLVAGIPTTLIGFGLVAFWFMVVRDDAIPRPRQGTGGLLYFGGLLLMTGLLASFYGGYALVTGKRT
jgi:hypothetical protein